MQAMLDFVVALVIALAAAAFAQFGVTLAPKDEPRPVPEARRTEAVQPATARPISAESPPRAAQGVDSPPSGVDKSVHRGA